VGFWVQERWDRAQKLWDLTREGQRAALGDRREGESGAPEGVEGGEGGDEGVESGGFEEIGVGVAVEGGGDIVGGGGGGEHDDGDASEGGVAFEGGEDLVAGEAGEVDVEVIAQGGTRVYAATGSGALSVVG